MQVLIDYVDAYLEPLGGIYEGRYHPWSQEEIAEIESWLGWRLPEDIVWFYSQYRMSRAPRNAGDHFDKDFLVIAAPKEVGSERAIPLEKYGITDSWVIVDTYQSFKSSGTDWEPEHEGMDKQRIEIANGYGVWTYYAYPDGSIKVEVDHEYVPFTVADSFTDFLARQVHVQEEPYT